MSSVCSSNRRNASQSSGSTPRSRTRSPAHSDPISRPNHARGRASSRFPRSRIALTNVDDATSLYYRLTSTAPS